MDADGNCTVCNRHHDDFAHVVDVDRSGSIIETASSPREIMRQRQNGVGQANSTHACILGKSFTVIFLHNFFSKLKSCRVRNFSHNLRTNSVEE